MPYRTTILLLTAGMIVLHVLEWLEVPSAMRAPHGDITADSPMRRLRLALRLEALYYLVAFPAFCRASNQLIGRLMIASAAYHWIGFAVIQINSFWRKKEHAIGRSSMWVVAVLDLAEVVVLASFSRALYAFPFSWP